MLEEKEVFMYLKYFHKNINVVFKPEGLFLSSLEAVWVRGKDIFKFPSLRSQGNDASFKVRVLDFPDGSVVESLCFQ